MAEFLNDGAVNLYHNNAIKMATSASGISVTGNVAVTGTVDGVDLQTLNTAVSANTSKTTNATHSGEVTGSGALTIADNVVDEANLKVSNSAVNGYMLTAQSGNTGGLTWAAAGGGATELITRTVISSGDSTVNFTGFDENKYDHYKFYFSNIVLATDNREFLVVTSSDGGSNYDTGSSDYRQTSLTQTGTPSTSTTPSFIVDNGNKPGVRMSINQGATITSELKTGLSGTLEIFNADDDTKFTTMNFNINYEDMFGYFGFRTRYGSAKRVESADVNAVQFKPSNGNFASGMITMYGIKKT